MTSYRELRESVYEANMELPRRGLVLYTFGNVSGIDRASGIVAIKPSGVEYDELTPEMIVLVDLDGTVVDSTLRPSSDTATHLVLYREFTTIGGVTHTHSTHATAWAQARRGIPCFGTTHADYCYGEIPCTNLMSARRIEGDYEVETGREIVERFDDLSPEQVPMVLVAGHGPFTWGKDPGESVYHSAILEQLAHMAAITIAVNPSIDPIPRPLLDRHFLRKHGADAYYGQSR